MYTVWIPYGKNEGKVGGQNHFLYSHGATIFTREKNVLLYSNTYDNILMIIIIIF